MSGSGGDDGNFGGGGGLICVGDDVGCTISEGCAATKAMEGGCSLYGGWVCFWVWLWWLSLGGGGFWFWVVVGVRLVWNLGSTGWILGSRVTRFVVSSNGVTEFEGC
ncbi:hypothetical protein LWI28_025920 [Acer negundo]|uniref:Transmembrane protein n=1 Tax=Acer negundo TaxID=4023 RepID=A0AAD5JNW4_ACENE|nr:hypothetical protein LWI28_025920 [Acer negundo]